MGGGGGTTDKRDLGIGIPKLVGIGRNIGKFCQHCVTFLQQRKHSDS